MPTRLPVLLQRWKSARAVAGASAKVAAISSSRPGMNAGKGKALLPSWGPVSREGLRPVNDDGAKIVHVGPRWPGLDQVAETAEKPRGIVVGEKMGRIEAAPPRP